MMDVKVSKDRLGDGLIEKTSSILDEVASKIVHKEEDENQ